MQAGALPAVPYNLARLGVIMRKDPESELEREGVLNPASARGRDGTPYLLPRLVAPGNESRIGLAKLIVDTGLCPLRWASRDRSASTSAAGA